MTTDRQLCYFSNLWPVFRSQNLLVVMFGVNIIAVALATDPIIPRVVEMVRVLLSANFYSDGNDAAPCKNVNVKAAVVAPSGRHGEWRRKHIPLRCYENPAPHGSDQITTSALPPKKFYQ